jgi:hypothetical protein
MTRYEMLAEARRQAPETPFWGDLNADGKEAFIRMMVDCFIIEEQLGPKVTGLLMGCFMATVMEID